MFTYIDLFSGAGGMSLGFEKAGFKNILANEIDDKFAETYKYNFPNNNLLIKDIAAITQSDIEKFTNNEPIDVVIGGPPCQGFSMAGRHGRTFIEDDRNYLFKEFLRIVKIVRPKVFVMENVARMKSHNNGKTIIEIINSFTALGYKIKFEVLQAANYNVPQKRQRIFIVGTLINTEFKFPIPKENYISVKEAISDLPPLKSGDKSDIPNHNAMNHSSQMLEKMAYVKNGGNRSQIPEILRPKSGDSRKYIRYDSDKPSVTVTGDMRKIFHYEQNRALTNRELARLQSFPDHFIFQGTSISIQQQIGNAVPPLLGYEIAISIKNCLKEEKLNELQFSKS